MDAQILSQLTFLFIGVFILFILPLLVFLSIFKYLCRVFARQFIKEWFNLEHKNLTNKLL